jgi:hypothetical protein
LIATRLLVCYLVALGIVFSPTQLAARLIPVKHKEETSHGFVVLRSQEGQTLATGDQIQTAEGEHVICEIVLHFADGSIYDDASVFSQNADFRLITDHLRQVGPSFPSLVDVRIDTASGTVKVLSGTGESAEPRSTT